MKSLKGFVSENESLPSVSVSKGDERLSSFDESLLKKDKEKREERLSIFENNRHLLKKLIALLVEGNLVKPVLKAYKLALSYGVITTKDFQTITSEANSYRWVSQLTRAGLLKPLAQAKLSRLDGYSPILYGVPGYTEKEVQEALSRYLKTRTKVWAYIQEVYQTTLCDVANQEIQFRKILWCANRYGAGLDRLKIAEEVARLHSQNGVRVWR